MEFILDAIDRASRQGECYPAVVTALTVPHIAGAVDFPGGGSQARYVTWIDGWFSPRFPTYLDHHIDGVALYALRCKLRHEGLTNPSQAPAASKSAAASHKRLIAFNVGPNISMHLCTSSDAAGDSWTVLRAETFCSDITSAARDWIATRKSDPTAMQMLKTLVDIRTDVPPYRAAYHSSALRYESQPHVTDRSRASLRLLLPDRYLSSFRIRAMRAFQPASLPRSARLALSARIE